MDDTGILCPRLMLPEGRTKFVLQLAHNKMGHVGIKTMGFTER